MSSTPKVPNLCPLDSGQFQLLFQNMDAFFWLRSADGSELLYVNPACEHVWGCMPEDLMSDPDRFFDVVHSADRDRVLEAVRLFELGSGQPRDELEYRVVHPDGGIRWIHECPADILDDGGAVLFRAGFAKDVTDQMLRDATLRRREVMPHEVRSRVLENIASMQPLDETLSVLAGGFEQIHPDALCSILLLEGDRLRHSAAPSLPEAYVRAIDGVTIGEGVGSCGTAAATGRLVVVEDVYAHAYWSDYLDAAAVAGIRACWSHPILDSVNRVLGTFAVYYRTPRRPAAWELEMISDFSQLAGIAIDRLRSFRALVQAKAELSFLISASPAVIYSCGPGGSCPTTFITGNIETQLGYIAKDFLDDPYFWENHLHPEDRDRVVAWHDAIGETGDTAMEYRFRRKDGSYVWLYDQHRLLHDEEGNDLVIVGSWFDVTARRGADARIRESEARLQAILDHSSVAIYLKDVEGRFILVNKQYENQTGIQFSEIQGKTVDEVFSPELARRFKATDQLALNSYSAIESEEDVDLVGGLLSFICTKYALRRPDGTPYAICSMATDITARKQMDEMLNSIAEGVSSETGEAFFRSLVKHVSDYTKASQILVAEISSDLQTTASTIAFCRDGEIVDNFTYDLKGTPCEDVLAGSMCVIAKGVDDAYPEDYCLKELGISSYAGVPLLDSRNEVIGLMVILDKSPIQDVERITRILRIFASRASAELERKRAESDKEQLEEQLRHAQKMEAVGTLSAGIAHDFSNVLTAIMAYTDIIDSHSEGDTTTASAIHGLRLASKQAVGITQSLLTFSRKRAVQKQPTDLCEVVRESIIILRHLLPSSIDLREYIPGFRPIWVNANASQLEQVVFNLALNARDAMPEGGVMDIVVDQHVDEDQEVQLSVVDTGEGISPEAIDHIFEPFFTLRSRTKGTGLGMAVVHGIVTDHEGTIEISTEQDKGTRFTITLPCCDAPVSDDAIVAGTEFRRKRSACILIVEDDLQIRGLMKSVLIDAGHHVYEVGDGEEAVSLFASKCDEIDIVIMDVDLPGKSGTECYVEMSKLKRVVRTIFATGSTDFDLDRDRYKDASLLRKPFSISSLLKSIEDSLECNPLSAPSA